MSRSFFVGLILSAGLLFVMPASVRAAESDDLVLDIGDMNLELKRVPHGSFTMGSPATEVGHEKDEEPQRPVTLTRDYWIAKTPITRGQFSHFVADTKYVTEAEKGQVGGSGWDGKALVQKKDFNWRNPGFAQTDDHPVVMVTFGDASAFAAWASRKTAKRVRLPSEAEWEFTARAGTTSPWYGAKTEEEVLAIGWFKPNGGTGTHPVAQKKANALGVFDMSGDVFEWCRDVYGPYSKEPGMDPENVVHTGTEPERRVLRGGSWLRDPKRGRSAARYRNAPGARNADNGFRVVVTADDMLGPGFVSPVDTAQTPAPASSNAPDGGVGPATGPTVDVPQDSSGWLLFAAPSLSALAVLGWIFGRRRGSAAGGDSGAMTRVTEDGFFVRLPGARVGSRVRYACKLDGAAVEDVVPFDGAEETFVYTGARPAAIRILEIVAGTAVRVPPPRPVERVERAERVERVVTQIEEEILEPAPRSLSKPPPSRIEEKVPSVIIAAGVEIEEEAETAPPPVVQEVTEPLVMPTPSPVSAKPTKPATLPSQQSAPEIEPEEEVEEDAAPIVPDPVISVRDIPAPPVASAPELEAVESSPPQVAMSLPPVAEEKEIEPDRVVSVRDLAVASFRPPPSQSPPPVSGPPPPPPVSEIIIPDPVVSVRDLPPLPPLPPEERVGPPTLAPSQALAALAALDALDEKSTMPDLRSMAPELKAPPEEKPEEKPQEPAQKLSAKARKRARAAARKAARKQRESQPDLNNDEKDDETAPAPPVAPNDDDED